MGQGLKRVNACTFYLNSSNDDYHLATLSKRHHRPIVANSVCKRISNAKWTIIVSNIKDAVSNTHLTVGKALLQNQRAGGPGGSGTPFLLDSKYFLYSTAIATAAATMPPYLAPILLSGTAKFSMIIGVMSDERVSVN